MYFACRLVLPCLMIHCYISFHITNGDTIYKYVRRISCLLLSVHLCAWDKSKMENLRIYSLLWHYQSAFLDTRGYVNENLHENMLLISHMKAILRKSVIMNWETWRSFVWITVNTETTLGWQPVILVRFSSKYKVTQQHAGRNAMLLWNTAVPSSDNTIQDNTGIQFCLIYLKK